MNIGIGAPTIRETYDCLIIFDWRTSAFCPEHEDYTLPPLPSLSPAQEPESPQDLPAKNVAPPVEEGVSMVILYKKPEARERVIRVFQEARARMPVVLGGRGRDDSTLLVSNGNMSAFGSLTDDDDFS